MCNFRFFIKKIEKIFFIYNNITFKTMERQQFINACTSGNLIDSKNLFQQNNFDMNVCEKAFRNACENGHLQTAQWLLSVKPSINISADYEYAFRWACVKGHLETAQWLLTLKPSINISAENEYAFRCACQNGHLETAQWLQPLCPENYSLYVNDGGVIIYKILTSLKMNGTIQKTELEICLICQENQEEIQTIDCKHNYCYTCIQKWVNTEHNTCPYCRASLENGFVKLVS